MKTFGRRNAELAFGVPASKRFHCATGLALKRISEGLSGLMTDQTIEKYLRLPYTVETVHDVGVDYEVWFAKVLELPGCMTEADTFAELGPMIEDAMRAWITVTVELGLPVPIPNICTHDFTPSQAA